MPRSGSVRSVTAGSLRAGDCDDPIRAGPCVCGGASIDDVIAAAGNCPVAAIFVVGESGDLYP